MMNIAVFFGGKSSEHDVSVVTALQMMENLDREKYNIIPIYITRDGDWYTGKKLMDINTYKNFDIGDKELTRCYLPANTRARQLFKFEREHGLFKKDSGVIASLDAAVLAMHGLNGEDGSLQGLLQLAQVPFTSCGVLGSAAGMDKILMKSAFLGADFPVLDYIYFDRGQLAEEAEVLAGKAEERLGYPMFVKPANLGSSIGISKARNREELLKAMEVAAHYDRRILVERGVDDLEEVNCSALGFGSDVRVSVCEMPVTWEEFLTYDEKYMRGAKSGGEKQGMQSLSRRIPAPISDELTARIQDYTRRVFQLFDCKGVIRIDYIIDKKDSSLYINEINTIPGSFAFYLWECSGLSYKELLDELIQYAVKAYEDSASSEYAYKSDILLNYSKGAESGSKGAKYSGKG